MTEILEYSDQKIGLEMDLTDEIREINK